MLRAFRDRLGRRPRPEPIPSDLRVSFTAASIREHFDGEPASRALARVSDERLEELARDALEDDRIWSLFDERCVEIYQAATGAKYTPPHAAAR